MNNTAPLLKASRLCIGYKKGKKEEKVLSGPLELEMHSGQLICLLGPNGAGKSTLIRTLAGLQPSLSGTVAINGKNITKLQPQERAKRLSMVLTERVQSGNLTAYSIIALGRFPYTNWLGTLQPHDREIVQLAMRKTDTTTFANRKLNELSDGEAQKVMLARALAQDTPIIILDEPTAHLDLPNRITMMRLLHQLAKTTAKSILLSTHDLDLALQSADEVWLLRSDGVLTKGAPEDVVLNGTFETAFHKEGFEFDKSSGTFSIHNGNGKSIGLTGEGAPLFWTKRALQREGFRVLADAAESIHIIDNGSTLQWKYKNETHDTIAGLLASLRTHYSI
ncbi:ABC transporter ATP-binding protein [Niastella caeni]|uniref:ABC transporter ATP-binding protein n=1 Tax=Niastella caeni TaxID=2569763 RepID=A0A4S8HRI9_9BACT|nr:ABC transporter ATP-binding protein [Niastella caeni]THU38118.1 ABC transporter ATP-binding protein [Niastella caeni]